MGLGQYGGQRGLSLCSRHLADLIFHSDSVKVGWCRLLPDPRSVYNRVTVQLRLIICQLQLRQRQLKIPKKVNLLHLLEIGFRLKVTQNNVIEIILNLNYSRVTRLYYGVKLSHFTQWPSKDIFSHERFHFQLITIQRA